MRIVKIKIDVISEETDNIIAKFEELGVTKSIEEDIIEIDSWIDLDKVTRVDQSLVENKFVINFIDETYVVTKDNPFEELCQN